MTTWTDERHEAARARCEAATEGPWEAQPDRTGTATVVLDPDGDALWDAVGTMQDADGEFIAHARTDLPALLDEVERLHAENAALKEQLSASQEQASYLGWAVSPDRQGGAW